MNAAFSNGFEWDRWSARWCDTCTYEATCPLIDMAYLGETPAEWTEVEPDGLETRYACSEYGPREGEPDARTLAGPDAMRSVPD
jgi:hypothetical protein